MKVERRSCFGLVLPLIELSDIIIYRVQAAFNEKEIGVSFEQWLMLELVGSNNGISQAELSKELFRFPSSITRSINVLIEKQLVEKTRSKNSKAKNEIYLTDEGKWFVKKNALVIEGILKQMITSQAARDLKLLTKDLKELQLSLAIE